MEEEPLQKGNVVQMNHSTKRMKNTGYYLIVSLLAVIIIALAVGNIMLDREKTWDVEYDMVNRRIEWQYAGQGAQP